MIGIFLELDAMMVQSFETAKCRIREVKREGKEKSGCILQLNMCKLAAYAGFKSRMWPALHVQFERCI